MFNRTRRALVLSEDAPAERARAQPEMRLPGAFNFRVCALDPVTGYGSQAIYTARQFMKYGIPFTLEPAIMWNTKYHVPNDVKRMLKFKPLKDAWELLLAPPMSQPMGTQTVWFSMWESSRLPRGTVDRLNQAKAVIVPCEWNQSIFSANGVARPIHKVQFGYDPSIFGYRPWKETGPITFGCGGRLAHGGCRKGVEDVVRAFLKAFPKSQDVRLEIKLHEDCEPNSEIPKDPRIKEIRETWCEEEMAVWYESLHCYVTMAKGEGFGLMPFQAAVCGRPTIGSLAHGHLEYLNSNNCFPARYTLEEAQSGYNYEGLWYPPSVSHVADLMQEVAEDSGLSRAKEQGLIASQDTQHMTWDLYGTRLIHTLKEEGII